MGMTCGPAPVSNQPQVAGHVSCIQVWIWMIWKVSKNDWPRDFYIETGPFSIWRATKNINTLDQLLQKPTNGTTTQILPQQTFAFFPFLFSGQTKMGFLWCSPLFPIFFVGFPHVSCCFPWFPHLHHWNQHGFPGISAAAPRGQRLRTDPSVHSAKASESHRGRRCPSRRARWVSGPGGQKPKGNPREKPRKMPCLM